MNMELEFHVVKQSIKRTDGNAPVSESVNYLTAEFNFDSSDWDNTVKTATFRSGVDVYTVLLDESNKCLVPWEVVRAGKLKVSVYGNGANEYRITADTVEVPVYASGYSEGEESQHPTPSQYEQLAGIISTKSSVVVNPAESATGTANKIKVDGTVYSISGGGGGGSSDYTDLTNKPSINNVTLAGNKSLDDLGIQSKLTFDNSPTSESNNPVKSGGIFTALDGKVDKVNGKGLSANDYTDADKTKVNGLNQVTANPTLAGTEADLTGLEIGNTKFKVPSGGGSAVDTVVDFGTVRTFCVVGDSYASGQIYKADLSNETVYALSWGQVLARMCGNTCINASFGGAMCSTWLSNAERGLSYLKSQTAQDLYLIQMGINDSRILGTAGLGDITDISSHEDYHDYGNTFYGNYGKIVAQIKEYAPNARIILMTFAYAYNATELAYNNAIKAIATYFEIPCIDVNTDSFYADNGWWDNERIANHPVALGYSAMARVNKKLIEQNMKNNASYWDTYGFASTPTPVEKTLSSISVSVVPSSYSVGDTLGTVTVTAHYSDNTTADVTSSATIDTTSVNMSTAGTYPVSASYAEDGVTKTASTNITVGSVVTPTVIVDGVYNGTISSANGHCDDNTVTVGSKVSTYVYANMDSAVDGKGLMYKLTSDGGLDEAKGVGFSFEIVSTPAGGIPTSKDLKTTRPVALTADGQWHNIVNQNNTQMVGENGKTIRAGLWSTSDSTATFPVTINNVHIQIGYV